MTFREIHNGDVFAYRCGCLFQIEQRALSQVGFNKAKCIFRCIMRKSDSGLYIWFLSERASKDVIAEALGSAITLLPWACISEGMAKRDGN